MSKPNKKDLIDMLLEMSKSYDNLPEHAMYSPVTHSDLVSVLTLLGAIFNSDYLSDPDSNLSDPDQG